MIRSPVPYTPCGDGDVTAAADGGRRSPASSPVGAKTWMRWLRLSATTMRPSRGDTATPRGALNSPSAEPGEPNLNANVPLGWNTRRRWLPMSDTTRRSALSNANEPTPPSWPSYA